MIWIMSDAVSKLFADGRLVSLDRGETLFFAGDRVRLIYLVAAGRVDLVRHTDAGARMVLQRVTPGQVLAEASAYSKTYHCDGFAEEVSEVRGIPVADFRARLDGDAAASGAWAAYLANDLQKARMHAEIRTLRTVGERLDAWMGTGQSLPPRGRWQDLAAELGVSRESLYREFAKRRV